MKGADKMEAKTKDLWVYIETDESGHAKEVGLELLSPGRRLADERGGRLVAVVFGGSNEAVDAAAVHGADAVISLEGAALRSYSVEAYTKAFCDLIEEYGPETLIIGATAVGRDFAPRLACRLRTGLTANATVLELAEDGNVEWIMPAFGGNLMATIICPYARPQIGTVHSGVFKKPEPTEDRAERIVKQFRNDCGTPGVELLELIKDAAGESVDLEGAEIIVAVGRGIGGAEGLKLAKALADVLDAPLGATRAAVDAGWISAQHQIGHSGKMVAPKLYIACGISGAIQHVAGMSEAKCIVAINTDADAPIFDVADYGIVGDINEVLPQLTDEIRRIKGV